MEASTWCRAATFGRVERERFGRVVRLESCIPRLLLSFGGYLVVLEKNARNWYVIRHETAYVLKRP